MESLLQKIFLKGEKIQQQVSRRISYPTLKKRFRKALEASNRRAFPGFIPYGKLILLADGVHYRFNGHDFVLYLLVIKQISQNKGYFLDPILLKGRESYGRWNRVLRSISPEIRYRIVALVSDDFRGSERVVSEREWVWQRCHFHLLYQLYRRLGRRKSWSPTRRLKEEAYLLVKTILREGDEQILKKEIDQLKFIRKDKLLSAKFRSILNGFLSSTEQFRSYLKYPELHLPVTNNSLESTAGVVRKQTGKLNTPQSLEVWTKGLLRMRQSVVCNGSNYQPN
jgi:transposase-like protein